MGEKTVYFKDLNGLIVACYERQEFDAFHDIIWTYDVVVKAQARIGVVIHYILARDTYTTKIKKTLKDLVTIVNYAVSQAIGRIDKLFAKLEQDRFKLKELIQGELRHGV